MFKKFWQWYEKHETFNLGFAAILFSLQLVHLYWLTTHIVFFRLFGQSYFNPSGTINLIITLVDYTEIPALIATSIVYLNKLRKHKTFKSILFLILLNSQWLHLFWITDEIVADMFTGNGALIVIPPLLAWIAILIDYLELPVIFETLKEFLGKIKNDNFKKAFTVFKEK